MDFADALLIAGMCVMVVCAFIVGRMIWTTLRADGEELRLRNINNDGRRLDLYLGLVWTGMLLVQASSILRHVQPGGIQNLSTLTVAATAGDIFICGVVAGRLLLRREMRWLNEKRAAQSGISN